MNFLKIRRTRNILTNIREYLRYGVNEDWILEFLVKNLNQKNPCYQDMNQDFLIFFL